MSPTASVIFKAGPVINGSPIGPRYLDRRARCTELIWLAQAIEASGLTPSDIQSIERMDNLALIRLGPRLVTIG